MITQTSDGVNYNTLSELSSDYVIGGLSVKMIQDKHSVSRSVVEKALRDDGVAKRNVEESHRLIDHATCGKEPYTPSEKEIKKACKEIQAGWTDKQEKTHDTTSTQDPVEILRATSFPAGHRKPSTINYTRE